MRNLLVTVIVLLLSGCNVFEPFHTAGSSGDVEDLISDARQCLGDGDHRKALEVMDKAMAIAPDDARVRYLHAVSVVGAYDIDMLDVLDILQPADKEFPVDAAGERVLLMTDAELENMYAAFRVVSVDLKPLWDVMIASGRELRRIRESEDVFLSYGVAETILGMLRVLDNDDTKDEFSLDERLVITKTPDAYELRLEDILLTALERDRIIDEAINRSWDHFLRGRHVLYCYYQFVTNEVIWTQPVAPPPASLAVEAEESVTGGMVKFVDEGVLALYEEKEDRESPAP